MALSDPVPLVRPCFPQRILVLSIHQPRLQKLTLRFPAVVRHRFIHVHVSFASLRRPHTSSFKSAIISRLIYLQPRSCDRASFILNTVNIRIENEMILENRYWMLSSFTLIGIISTRNYFNVKKKNRSENIDFRVRVEEQRNNCNEMQGNPN